MSRSIRNAAITTPFLAVLLMLAAATAFAQDSKVSSASPANSSSEDASRRDDQSMSLDRIREGLSRTTPLQETLEKQPTFRVDVQDKNPFEELLTTLDLKHYPPVPGGLYAAEQQRITNNPVDHPLTQNYAAFSGPELITIAVENLVGKYLGRMATNAITNADRAHAEAAARAEVSEAVSRYCSALPNHGADETLCTTRILP